MAAPAGPGVVSIDGVQYALADAKISVFDRGFLFGDSAFEVMRTYGGVPFRLGDHLARLQLSCERLLIPLSVSSEALETEVGAVMSASGLEEVYIRIVVTRGSGPIGIIIDGSMTPSVLVYALPMSLPPIEDYESGVAVALARIGRPTDGTSAEGAKASNYLGSVLAVHEVRQRGCVEAIIVGGGGQVIEGATSNVFAVHDGVVITPPSRVGILEGITRRTVMELCESAGRSCREQQMHPRDLYTADEVFITSSIREVMPVVRVDDVAIGAGVPGPVTRALLVAYRDLTTSAVTGKF